MSGMRMVEKRRRASGADKSRTPSRTESGKGSSRPLPQRYHHAPHLGADMRIVTALGVLAALAAFGALAQEQQPSRLDTVQKQQKLRVCTPGLSSRPKRFTKWRASSTASPERSANDGIFTTISASR